MATITSLGFTIFSRYTGDGVRAARRDLDSFNSHVGASATRLGALFGSAGRGVAAFGVHIRQASDRMGAFATRTLTADRQMDRLISRAKILSTLRIAMIPALIQLGPVIGTAAGAFAAMGATAGAAFGIFGAAVAGAIQRTVGFNSSVGNLYKELVQAKQALSQMTPGTKHYEKQLEKVNKLQDQYNHALKDAKPAQREFLNSMISLNDAWNKFIAQTQDKSLTFATTIIQGLTAAIGKLKPVFDAVYPSFQRLANAFKAWASGSGMDRFIQTLVTYGVPALEALLRVGRNLMTVLGAGMRAFAPLGASLANALARMSAEAAKWAKEGGFERFIKTAVERGPKAKELMENLGVAFGKFWEAVKGLGPISLELALALSKIVAAMPVGMIQALIVVFMAWRVAMIALVAVKIVSFIISMVAGIGRLITVMRTLGSLCLITRIHLAALAVSAGLHAAAARAGALATAAHAAAMTLFSRAAMTAKLHAAGAAVSAAAHGVAARAGALATAAHAAAMTLFSRAALAAKVQTAAATVATVAHTVASRAGAIALRAWALAQALVNAALLANPLTWIVIAIAAVVAGIVLLATKTQFFQTVWNTVWGAIKTATQAVWNALQAAWDAFIGALGTAWTAVSGALSTAWNATWNGIKTAVETVWNAMKIGWEAFINALATAWTAVSTALSTAWNATWNAIKTAVETIWNGLKAGWEAFVNALATAWNTLSAALSTAWNATWNAIKTAAETVWNGLKAGWEGLINGLGTAWSAVSGALSTAWSASWNAIKIAGEAVWNAMKIAWEAFINGLQVIWTTVSSALTTAWNAVWNGLRTAAEAVWNALRTAWQAVVSFFSSTWSSFSGALTAAWNATWNALRAAGEAVWNAMRAAWTAIWNAFRSIWDTFRAWFHNSWTVLWDIVRSAAQAVWNGMQAAWQAFLNLFRSIWDTVRAWFYNSWTVLWNIIREAAQAAWNLIRSAWETFLNAFKAIWDAVRAWFYDSWTVLWRIIREAAETVWNWLESTWETFLNTFRDIWDDFRSWFYDSWTGIWNLVKDAANDIWHEIGEIIEKAVNGVIGLINRLIDGFNNITNAVGIDVKIGKIDPVNFNFDQGGVVSFAYGGMTGGPDCELRAYAKGTGRVDLRKGGAIGGYAPGRDTVPAILSRGEGVLTPEAVRGLGGPGFVNSANRKFAGHRGAGKGAPSFDKFGNQQFAVGGITAAALAKAGVPLSMVTQGEYSNGALSAGTHLGGGAVDLATTSGDVLARLKAAGFAAWVRGPEHGMSPHIHAVLMNHPDLSPQARAQVDDFLMGGDGLGAGGGGGASGFFSSIFGNIGEILKAIVQGKSLGDAIGDAIGGDSGIGGFFGNIIGGIADVLTGGGGMPEMFAKMVLGAIDSAALDTAFDFVLDGIAGGFGAGLFGEIITGLMKKLWETVKEFILGKAAEAKDSFALADFAGGFGDVQSWAPLAAVALARAGISPDQLDEFLALMQAESGGNPMAMNNWDSNAQIGQNSAGLMQVIPATFQMFRDHDLPNNIFDPLANMVAAANYIKNRYGGKVPGSPYALGTPGATAGPHLVGEQGPEMVNFRGGETVTPAKETMALLSKAAAPAVPAVASNGLPKPGDIISPIQGLLKKAPEGEGWFGDIIAAAQHMMTTVQTAWKGTVEAGVRATPLIEGVTDRVGGEVGAEVPAKLNAMATASQANWSAMNANAQTVWTQLRDMVFVPAELHQGTNMPATAQKMNLSSQAAWLAMNAQALAQWILMRDVTFAEAELHQGTTMPTTSATMQAASDAAWTTMNTTSSEQYTAMQDNTIVPLETHMSATMPEASASMQEAVGAAFTGMVETIVAQLDAAIAKIQEFIAATEAAIAAAQALAAAQAASAAAGGGGGGAGGVGGGSDLNAALARAGNPPILQGPYSNGALSAGTHTGGGVVDVPVSYFQAMLDAGFIGWIRSGPAWAGNEHAHMILPGAPDLSPQARWQVQDYYAGGDGLGIPSNLARGTNHARRGWTWVGEQGPELLRMRGGEQVMPHTQSIAFATGYARAMSRKMKDPEFRTGGVPLAALEKHGLVVRSGDGGGVVVEMPIHVQGNLDHAAVDRLESEVLPKLRTLLHKKTGHHN